jgi:hypothetical protein
MKSAAPFAGGHRNLTLQAQDEHPARRQGHLFNQKNFMFGFVVWTVAAAIAGGLG